MRDSTNLNHEKTAFKQSLFIASQELGSSISSKFFAWTIWEFSLEGCDRCNIASANPLLTYFPLLQYFPPLQYCLSKPTAHIFPTEKISALRRNPTWNSFDFSAAFSVTPFGSLPLFTIYCSAPTTKIVNSKKIAFNRTTGRCRETNLGWHLCGEILDPKKLFFKHKNSLAL